MFSLKPKEGGAVNTPPPPPPVNTNLLKGGIGLALVLILGLGYNAYSTRVIMQSQIDVLQQQLEDQVDQMKAVKKRDTDMGADIDVVTKRIGVTAQELDVSRRFAEKLKAEQEKAKEQLANELATKATRSEERRVGKECRL